LILLAHKLDVKIAKTTTHACLLTRVSTHVLYSTRKGAKASKSRVNPAGIFRARWVPRVETLGYIKEITTSWIRLALRTSQDSPDPPKAPRQEKALKLGKAG
jgi:hypothetical protein